VHGAANVRVCGSVARGDARPGSDIDLVVDMAGERDLLDLSELVLDLQRELGRPVEVLRAPPAHAPPAHSPVRHILAAAIPLDAQAAACARLSGELKARHPGVRWRALTGLPGILGHGPYPAWEISRNHLTQLRAVLDTETPPAADR